MYAKVEFAMGVLENIILTLTHLGQILFIGLPWAYKRNRGISREMRAVLHDVYMRH